MGKNVHVIKRFETSEKHKLKSILESENRFYFIKSKICVGSLIVLSTVSDNLNYKYLLIDRIRTILAFSIQLREKSYFPKFSIDKMYQEFKIELSCENIFYLTLILINSM